MGGSLTSQKRGKATILRSKPIPTDPYSLAQAYQRWDYRDYAYLWTLESNASKQSYRTRASRYHITGFSLWMREHLRDLPDIAGRWHLDEKGGATAYDSSRNTNHGTIFGASPADGRIDGAFDFDGINDRITLPDVPSLHLNNVYTLQFFIQTTKTTLNSLCGDINAAFGFFLIRDELTRIQFEPSSADGLGCIINYAAHGSIIGPDFFLLTLVMNTPTLSAYYNNTLLGSCNPAGAITDLTLSYLGYGYTALPGSWFNGRLDHFSAIERALDLTEITRHSQRRYPP